MGLTNHLHSGQTTIMVADQPVYRNAKQLQWCYPDQCRTLFIMLGPLHIEMAFMSAIGDWVKGSGWPDIFNRAKLSTVGRVENFLVGNKVKRTRYTLQVSLASLISLATKAFNLCNEELNFEDWKQQLFLNLQSQRFGLLYSNLKLS